MTSRRSFFAGFARAAAIIALAPQIAFGVIKKGAVAVEAPKTFQCIREYYQCPKTGKWTLFYDPDEGFYRKPPANVGLWKTSWGHQDFEITCVMAPQSARERPDADVR